MTDNDIIRKLRMIQKAMLCEGDLQRASTISRTIDFIDRQKAEVERLNHIVDANKMVGAKAVKEFAERVKETALTSINVGGSTYLCVVLHHLDNLVKEFTEGKADE